MIAIMRLLLNALMKLEKKLVHEKKVGFECS